MSFDPESAGWADMDWFRQAIDDGTLQVIKVTSTDANELQSAINTSGPTLVVFEVGGVFDFGGPHFTANGGQTYIAGQTAPEPGVHITKTSFAIGADDFVLEHVAIRPGDEVEDPGQADGITTESNTSNIIINHCSVGWSIDENITVDDGSSNVTVANSFFSHTLFDSIHPEGEHSMGFMVDTGVSNISGVGNLVANHEWRSPRFAGTGHLYWANNYVWNFVSRGIGLREGAEATIIGNFYERGGKDDKSTVLHDSTVTLYVDPDNIEQSNTPSFEGDGQADGEVVSSPIQEPSGFSPIAASDTKKHVLDNSGMRPAQRTDYDTMLVQDIRDGNSGLINSQSEVGGYPDYSTTTHSLNVPDDSNIVSWLQDYSDTVTVGSSDGGGSGGSDGSSTTGGVKYWDGSSWQSLSSLDVYTA